jgi:hypothetical protein
LIAPQSRSLTLSQPCSGTPARARVTVRSMLEERITRLERSGNALAIITAAAAVAVILWFLPADG